MDCAGLIVGTATEMGISVEDKTDYPRLPKDDEMEQFIDAQCELAENDELGNILLIPGDGTIHLAVITRLNPVYIAHAHQPSGKVIEHRLSSAMRRKVKKVYRWPS